MLLGFLALLGLLAIPLYWALVIWIIIDIVKTNIESNKIVWILVIVFFPILGMFAYCISYKKTKMLIASIAVVLIFVIGMVAPVVTPDYSYISEANETITKP